MDDSRSKRKRRKTSPGRLKTAPDVKSPEVPSSQAESHATSSTASTPKLEEPAFHSEAGSKDVRAHKSPEIAARSKSPSAPPATKATSKDVELAMPPKTPGKTLAAATAASPTLGASPGNRWQTPSADELPFAAPYYSMQDQEPLTDGKRTMEGEQRTTAGSQGLLQTTSRKTTGATTEIQVSETTVLLDVNPYVRYPLVSLNILIWIVGLTLILVGLYAYIETWNQTQYLEFNSSLSLYSVVLVRIEVTVMVVGASLLSLSLCGCLGALRENTCLLRTYSYLITALLVTNLILGLVVFFLPIQFKKMLRYMLSKNLVIHYRDNPDFQQLIDSVQEELRCCGISERAFRDWNDNIYFNCSRSNPSNERCSVPHSCCRRNDSLTVVSLFCGRGVLNKTDYDAWLKVYTGNCLDAAHRYIREHVTIITGMCLVVVILLAFVQMVTQALIDEIIIIRKIYDKFYDRVHDIRVAQGLTD